VSTNLGSVTTNRATYTLQLGDALNSNAHVVMVTGLEYDANGAITEIEITEQTPPQMKRSYYSPYSLYLKYSGYTIQRYYGDVPAAPNQDEEAPVISDVVYSEVSASGYTISCKVTDNMGVYRVAFPTWTIHNGQDDLAADFMNTQQGTKNGDIYTFRVNASAHNNEGGFYVTHIYAEDQAGNTVNLPLSHVEVRNDNAAPVISDVRYSQVSAAGYTISCTVTDDWGVSSVAFPTWTVNNGQDDLAEQFLITQRGQKDGNTYTFRVNASEHNNETGEYVTHIYATDCAGNTVSLPLNTVIVRDDTVNPEISDIVVSNVSSAGYLVSCTVTDDWGVSSVAFPTWTIAGGQDDLPEQFMTTQLGTRDGNRFSFYVKASDHNNEIGAYLTHIYAVDCAGNTVSCAVDIVMVQDKITVKDTSDYVLTDGYLMNVAQGTVADALVSQLENTGLDVFLANGNAVSGDMRVTTGTRVVLSVDGIEVDAVTVVILGDVDQNGQIDVMDHGLVREYFLLNAELSKCQFLAADVDRNGVVDITDYLQIKAKALGRHEFSAQ
jgi:hypothetical protein